MSDRHTERTCAHRQVNERWRRQYGSIIYGKVKVKSDKRDERWFLLEGYEEKRWDQKPMCC
jgi:hypothetical protein